MARKYRGRPLLLEGGRLLTGVDPNTVVDMARVDLGLFGF